MLAGSFLHGEMKSPRRKSRWPYSKYNGNKSGGNVITSPKPPGVPSRATYSIIGSEIYFIGSYGGAVKMIHLVDSPSFIHLNLVCIDLLMIPEKCSPSLSIPDPSLWKFWLTNFKWLRNTTAEKSTRLQLVSIRLSGFRWIQILPFRQTRLFRWRQ